MRKQLLVTPRGWADDDRPVVALLTHSARLSGAELMLTRIAPHLRRFRPVVIVGESGPVEEALVSQDVAVMRLPLPDVVGEHSGARSSGVARGGILCRAIASFRYARRLATTLRDLGVDVVYTHSAKAHLYGGLAGRLAGLPVVLHSHTIVNRRSMRGSAVVAARAGAALLPRAVIANSQAGLASLGRFARRRPTAVIPPPLDLPQDIPDRRERDVLRFVVAGRICPGKGQTLAIRAYAKVRAELGCESELLIVGAPMFNRDEEYAEALHPLARALGVADSVRIRGHQPNPAAILADADVLVHSAIEPEGFGQVIAEALAVGTPAIVPDDGGPREIVDHGVNGLVYERGDVDALADAMLHLARDRSARARMGEKARDVASRYDAATVVARTEDFL
ncbi:glycosyltransferase [Microbacterium sp. NPDC057407]|uniref:glycosyltransferase n=1 Tax=Microbacterium sp. NPDC057407 TaxID=3346120 RepID=UPI00367095C1